MSKELDIGKECCDIWNKLKDKTKMIDYLIESKKQIADLEAKLAELNKEPLNCSQIENGMSLCVIQKSEIAQLKQQLAEKDDRISRLQFEVQQALSNSLGKTIKELIEFDNQDKISFCIDKLSRVRNRINSFKYDEIKCLNKEDAIEDCLEAIDNQIEELKKEMK